MATEGGGDEKLQSKGTELSQPTGGVAQIEPTDESQLKLPFIASEPLREDQVQNAVKFLSHPKVRGSAVIYRRSFLERKGLTKEEIDEAFRRVPDPPPNATTAEIVSTSQATQPRPSTNLQPQASVQPTPLAFAQVGAVSLGPTSQKPRFNWSHALIAIGVLSASGAGSAVLFKKVVLPRLKAWIRRVAVEDNGSAKEDEASKSLAAETAEAAKAAASAAAIVATASQELLKSKNEDRKYFEAFMGMIDVQVKEMKIMSEAIHKLEKAREQDKLIDEYVQYATTNGTSNNSWKPLQVNQTDTVNQVKVNGTQNTNYGAAGQSPAPPSVEPTAASHPKSYMEIMAMVQRGEKPPNIREINDMPPNPNQSPSKPLIAPRTKPWETLQQSSVPHPQENGQSQDAPSEPWWRKKSVKITELEPEGEEPLGRVAANDWPPPSSQRTWVPPQPPSVAIPESAAAIRHPKPSPEETMMKSSADDNGVVSQQSEIVEEEEEERNGGHVAATDWPPSSHTWVPPHRRAAIRHPKPSPEEMTKSSTDGNGVVSQQSEIEEEEEERNGVEVI